MNPTEMALGLQPAAHIYDPRSSLSTKGAFACNNQPVNHHFNLQQRSHDFRQPFVNVYQQFTSVPLSAIQPIEHSPYNPHMMNHNIHTQEPCAFSYDAHCLSPNLPDSPNDSRPGTASSMIHTIQPQPHRGPPPLLDRARGWTGSMISLSLQQPYQLHTFMANSDGTISNFAPSPYMPSDRTMLTSVERTSLKRSAEDPLEAEIRNDGDTESKGKRRCTEAQVRGVAFTALVHICRTNLSVDGFHLLEQSEADVPPDLHISAVERKYMGDGTTLAVTFTSSGNISANTRQNSTFKAPKRTGLSSRHTTFQQSPGRQTSHFCCRSSAIYYRTRRCHLPLIRETQVAYYRRHISTGCWHNDLRGRIRTRPAGISRFVRRRVDAL